MSHVTHPPARHLRSLTIGRLGTRSVQHVFACNGGHEMYFTRYNFRQNAGKPVKCDECREYYVLPKQEPAA